eukprot:scaffold255291_cov29-Tisochrysis_lutea.AAC.2
MARLGPLRCGCLPRLPHPPDYVHACRHVIAPFCASGARPSPLARLCARRSAQAAPTRHPTMWRP